MISRARSKEPGTSKMSPKKIRTHARPILQESWQIEKWTKIISASMVKFSSCPHNLCKPCERKFCGSVAVECSVGALLPQMKCGSKFQDYDRNPRS